MAVRLILILRPCLFCHFSYLPIPTLLYYTENSPFVQSYDCMYATDVNAPYMKYCRQSNESEPLQRDFNQSCHNGGQLWPFDELSDRNVCASDVLAWSSSVEQSDHYSKYLSNSSLDVGDQYICNCTNPSSFEKFCEYEFYDGEINFIDARRKQFESRRVFRLENKINVGSQLHNSRPGYLTLECDSELLCLDWRSICDGKEQCMDGVDEDHCELLEFNECEDDGYRCANGMCIPEEYWIDSQRDCMDWTDEISAVSRPGEYCFHTPELICDEHLCLSNQWSCGDGQCISGKADRHTGNRYGSAHYCHNLRDVQYMCESVTRGSQPWWTIDEGYCLPYGLAYQTLGLRTTSTEDTYSVSIKCALGDSLDQDCTCKNTTQCRHLTAGSCWGESLIYPRSGAIISRYTYMLYRRDDDWIQKKPILLGFKGRIKCLNYQFVTNDGILVPILEHFPLNDYSPLGYLVFLNK